MDEASLKRLHGSLSALIDEISQQLKQAIKDDDWERFGPRFKRWRRRCSSILLNSLGPGEEADFDHEVSGTTLSVTASKEDQHTFTVRKHLHYLKALLENIEEHPEEYLQSPGEQFLDLQTEKASLSGKHVFIVHGHDDVATLELERELRDTFKLEPSVLRYKPGRGRTLIEKFEQEAEPSRFSFIIMTADDRVRPAISDEQEKFYSQARPNVFFELGWLCGRIGRENTCILFKEGTKIHSDFDGVNRHEFTKSVKEVFSEVRKELVAAGYDESKKEFDL